MPSGDVTVTSTVPADPEGDVAVIWVSLTIVKLVADVLDLESPLPGRVASALDYETREAFLDDYQRRTDAVRATYAELMQ